MNLGFWSPYLLAWAAVFLAVVSALPNISPLLGLRRWYQRLTVLAWGLLAVVVGLTVAYSSPWVLGGGVLIGGIVALVYASRTRQTRNLEKEALDFAQALVGMMAGGDSLVQALQRAAQDQDIARLYPRLTAQAQEMLGHATTGTPLSSSIRLVAESLPVTVSNLWHALAMLAELIETEGGTLPVEAQRLTVQSMLSIQRDVQTINAELKTEMANMELAKWIFVLIIPGVNVYMAFQIAGYLENFIASLVGKVVLGIEFLALLAIFAIFSRLQKVPEVQL